MIMNLERPSYEFEQHDQKINSSVFWHAVWAVYFSVLFAFVLDKQK